MAYRIAMMALLLSFWAWGSMLLAQEQNTEGEDVPISGGVIYEPVRGEDNKLRDPFKSPFELEQEKRDKDKANRATLADAEKRLAFNIGELELKGIFLQATTGYWAIFRIGDRYDWFQVGEKFRDGDLVNITDGAVVFNQFVSEDGTQVRELIKELHRGEE